MSDDRIATREGGERRGRVSLSTFGARLQREAIGRGGGRYVGKSEERVGMSTLPPLPPPTFGIGKLALKVYFKFVWKRREKKEWKGGKRGEGRREKELSNKTG